MHLASFDIGINKWKLFILCFLLILFVGLVLIILASFFLIKWMRISIDEHNVYFNEYSSACKKMLKKYGNYSIRRLYLVRQPITKMARIFMNLITLNHFDDAVTRYIDTKDRVFYPRHTFLIAEIKLPDNSRKSVLIEKNNCIKLAVDFHMREEQDVCRVQLDSKTHTIKSILERTRERIGNKEFFNWHICRNNCQMLIKEILITLGQFNVKRERFMYQADFANKLDFSDFSLHIINCIANTYNMIENYLGISLYF